MAAHSSSLAWKIPWMEEPGRLQSMGLLRVMTDRTEQLHFHCSLSCIEEGNGNPLQCSCLENPRDGGAWQAAVYGVAESDTTEVTQQQQQQHGSSEIIFSLPPRLSWHLPLVKQNFNLILLLRVQPILFLSYKRHFKFQLHYHCPVCQLFVPDLQYSFMSPSRVCAKMLTFLFQLMPI